MIPDCDTFLKAFEYGYGIVLVGTVVFFLVYGGLVKLYKLITKPKWYEV
jgi:hypothetical protein